MTIKHSKSPCCRAPIYKYGGRRRQCSGCKKTWSRYQHRRGPKRKRYSSNLLRRIVYDGEPIGRQVRYYSVGKEALTKRTQHLLRIAGQNHVSRIFRGRYVLLADGLWYECEKADWVLYLLILKPVRRNYGYLLDPVMVKGKESIHGWQTAINTLTEPVKQRIVCLVSDNAYGAKRVARDYGWLHQLCHFHLLKELYRRRGRRKGPKIKGYMVREIIFQSVKKLLQPQDKDEICKLQQTLADAIADPACPYKLAMMVREFRRNLSLYRTYWKYPEYTIPRTTGVCESYGKLIRNRTKTLKTASAIQQWATAFARLRKKLICNGTKKNPQK